jgi:5'-nucleotidase
MDGVLCDFEGAMALALEREPGRRYPQSRVGFFLELAPLPGAIEAVNSLREQPQLAVYVLTAPSNFNPHSYTEKRLWVEEQFDFAFTERLIICSDKSLLKGDVLVDDHHEGRGQEGFEGQLLHFGTPACPDWESALAQINEIRT